MVDASNSDFERLDTAPVAGAGRQFLLREGIVFLNHGSFGACPRPIFEEYQRWQRTLEEQPVEFLGRRLDDLLAEARASLAAYLGTEADNLVFVPNATTGMNIVARSLRLAPGDEVLGTNHEYGAVQRTWQFVCEQQGAHYRAQRLMPPFTSTQSQVDAFWQGVTARTKVIVISHITSPTALMLPVAEICQRAADAGILTVIDGAHAPGQIELHLDALGADFYTGNLHKWLSAPKGSAFLYARPARQALLQPLVVSWGWRAEEPGVSPFQDYFGWTGTDDPAAYLSVPAAIAFQQQHDWPTVRAACHTLAAQARERIAALTGLPPFCPDAPQWWAQMCVAPLPEGDGATRKRRLWDEYQIEVPIVTWEGWQFVRVSIQAYNSQRDVDRLITALAELSSQA